MKKFISFSGGVESTTMCILYGGDADAIFSDTGSEHKKMYERLNYVEDKIRLIHPNFKIIRIVPNVVFKGIKVKTIEERAIVGMFMPSPQMRWCTGDFKIIPIDKYLEKQHIRGMTNDLELMIGLNFDEQGREGNAEKMDNVIYSYPLIEDGYTRKDCEDILDKHDLHPNFPIYMSRGGCRMCPFKQEKEYRALYYLDKEEFIEVMLFEEAIQDRRKKFYSIMNSTKSLRQLMNECEMNLFGRDEIIESYKKEKVKEVSCGLFCHR